MYLRRVVLQDIKSLDFVDLPLVPDETNYAGWTVITGDNGSGKTALLKAIVLALFGPDQSHGLLEAPDFTGWVASGKTQGAISVEVRPDHNVDKTVRGGAPVRRTFWAEVEIDDRTALWEVHSADRFKQKQQGATNGPWAGGSAGWAIIAYGPFRRLYGSSPSATRWMTMPGRVPQVITLFREDSALSEGEEWLKDLDHRKLSRNATTEGRVIEELLLLLGDDFLRNGLRIDSVGPDGLLLKDAGGRTIPLNDMSEGYRSTLAMVIDIYRHFVKIYGPGIVSKAAAQDSDHYVVNRPGVILIDEIDAHLHPEWQRQIGFWLKQHFPTVQFIVTTHSPLVCQAADDGRIYHMPQPGEGEPFLLDRQDFDAIRRGKPDEILVSPAFGLAHTRSPLAVKNRERYAQLNSLQNTRRPLEPNELQELQQLSLFVDD